MKRTWGGPNAPHIKTLTLGKNIVIIQRATGNGPPDTKVVDVHLHGHSYNSLFISIRSRGRHPLTRLQRQKAPKAPLTHCSLGSARFQKIKSETAPAKKKKKKNWSHNITVFRLVVRRQTDHVKKRIRDNCFGRRGLKCWQGQMSFSFFTLEMHLGCSNQHPEWAGKEYLMINSLVETNTITVTFEYQHDFIKSAIACRVLRAPLHCEPIWAVVMAG